MSMPLTKNLKLTEEENKEFLSLVSREIKKVSGEWEVDKSAILMGHVLTGGDIHIGHVSTEEK